MISLPVTVSPVKAILAMRGFGQRLARLDAKPLTMLSTPGGSMSAISSASTKIERRLLGGLEHGAVARRQRGRQLPRRHQQREVPRDDLADHAQRLVEMIGDGVVVDLEMPPSCARMQPAK
jgi:ParB family chromosome partitioning protein